jgi:hypothetical protein
MTLLLICIAANLIIFSLAAIVVFGPGSIRL